jgi:hypothetical protein
MSIRAACLAAALGAMGFAAGWAAGEEKPAPPWVRTVTPARALYVSPDGAGTGETRQSPMSPAAAVAGAQPGDRYWFLPGTYRGDFRLGGRGTKEQPIVYRAVPGKRVTIDGSVEVGGAYNWLWGFEIVDPRLTDHPVQARGPGVHLINNVIHNAGGGIGGWATGPDHVYYGNIVYGVGGDVDPPERRTNYPTYTQNDFDRHGYKYFVQNMFLEGRPYNPNFNFHGYTEGGFVSGFHLVGNIMANGRFLIGGLNEPHHHQIVEGNYFYNTPLVQFGYRRPIQFEFRGNYLGRSTLSVPFLWGVGVGTGERAFVKPRPSVVTGNTIVHPPGAHVSVRTSAYVGEARPDGEVPIDPKDRIDENTYSEPFRGELHAAGKQAALDLEGWRRESAAAGSAFDAAARLIPPPTEPLVAAMANEYEPGRGHVVVFNWGKAAAVSADLSSIVAPRAGFQVHHARKSFEAPVVQGRYEGPVELPMDGAEFDAFLVRPLPEPQ